MMVNHDDEFINVIRKLHLDKGTLDKVTIHYIELCDKHIKEGFLSPQLVLTYILLKNYSYLSKNPKIDNLYKQLIDIVKKEFVEIDAILTNHQPFITHKMSVDDILSRLAFINMLIDPKNQAQVKEHKQLISSLAEIAIDEIDPNTSIGLSFRH